MNKFLKFASTVLGFLLLVISIVWSKDGFGFDFGQSLSVGWVNFVGYTLALSATTLQFIFSTEYRKLNLTLIALGVISYVYSISTNVSGIAGMRAAEMANWMDYVLAVIMDVAPEPMIAWGLGQALSGDVLGNLFLFMEGNDKQKTSNQKTKSRSSGSDRRKQLEQEYRQPNDKKYSTNRRDGYTPRKSKAPNGYHALK